jgi:L-asparaginase
MQSIRSNTVVLLGTGGTIAGTAPDALRITGYESAQLRIDQIADAVPGLARSLAAGGIVLQAEQVAQIDSKNMEPAVWQRLAGACAAHLARDEVRGVVVTHGTDTLEETAWLLHRVLAPAKPLVLTAAMRPATAVSADGPGNLLDAMRVATGALVNGVSVVMAGAVWHPHGLRKGHTMRTDAFFGSDAGPIGRLDDGVWRPFRLPPAADALGLAAIARDPAAWPRVEIVMQHAGADGRVVDLLVQDGVRGLVIAGTGHGTVSDRLAAAIARARSAGVVVKLASRCAAGPVLASAGALLGAGASGELAPPQARVELLLELLRELLREESPPHPIA